MATHVGKKFVLLSPEVYETLLQKTSNIKNILAAPEKVALKEVDSNMKSIWQRDDIRDDEKVKSYTKDLNSLNRYRDSILNLTGNYQNEKQTEKTFTNVEKKPKETLPVVGNHEKGTVEDVIQTLPKTVRKEATQILRFLKSNPNKMTWNDEKELVYQGTVLHVSNISDLLMDTLSNRKKTISPTLFRNTFSKGLNDTIPKEWAKNTKMKDMMEYQNKENVKRLHKRSRSTPYPSEIKKNKIVTSNSPTKWLSSKSKIS